MERIAVRSRDIAIVGFDQDSSTLEVAFRSGSVYRYEGVSEDKFNDFMKAPSFGKYFKDNIRNKFPYEKVS